MTSDRLIMLSRIFFYLLVFIYIYTYIVPTSKIRCYQRHTLLPMINLNPTNRQSQDESGQKDTDVIKNSSQ